MDVLFSNIGNKLMMLAKVLAGIGIVCFCIAVVIEVVTLFDAFNGMLLLSMGVSGLVILVSSWPIYAFGQLVNDVHRMSAGGAAHSAPDQLPDL